MLQVSETIFDSLDWSLLMLAEVCRTTNMHNINVHNNNDQEAQLLQTDRASAPHTIHRRHQ